MVLQCVHYCRLALKVLGSQAGFMEKLTFALDLVTSIFYAGLKDIHT